MEFWIFGIIVVLLGLTIAIYIVRRRHNKEIAELELQKQQIQNKPIMEEMTKVKRLNMNGQTEEMFERWRTVWTDVTDVQMPQVDSLLFDAEECVDRLQFRKSADIQARIREKIVDCNAKMNGILEELNGLIGSEEKNRIEMEQLIEQYRSARKALLAHQHTFGAAAGPLEQRLDSFGPAIADFEELTAGGNYLQAREAVIALQQEGASLFELLHEIPDLLTEVQQRLPSMVHDLALGKAEMEGRGYVLDHLELNERLPELEGELGRIRDAVSTLEIAPAKLRAGEIADELDAMYDLLEKEVHAKHYVDERFEEVGTRLKAVRRAAVEAGEEAALVQQSYQLGEQEADEPGQHLQDIQSLGERYQALIEQREAGVSPASEMETELRDILEKTDIQEDWCAAYANRLHNLRIDETEARARLSELRARLLKVERLLHRSGLPGIPPEIEARMEEADERLFLTEEELKKAPINMPQVNAVLDRAQTAVQELADIAAKLIEDVRLIERIIQYGNRYRAGNAEMDARLREAESAFLNLRYAKALEEAALAVEAVEPGALKRIEVLAQEPTA